MNFYNDQPFYNRYETNNNGLTKGIETSVKKTGVLQEKYRTGVYAYQQEDAFPSHFLSLHTMEMGNLAMEDITPLELIT
jgi:hypothetical protein